ncbi:MAG: hypothetical protein HQK97_06870 [Nitrospirae bacterium]|nr:hypothetical protein [Nitrospirota bacterium]
MIIDSQPAPIDKRKGADVITKSIHWAIASCWVGLFVAWSYVYYAMPDPHHTRSYWDVSMLKKAFIAINVLLLISLVGLLESFFRHHRKTDTIPKTLTIMVIMSLVGIVVVYSYF